ncbi:contactin-2 [Heptranchias perlo]|uniref:contactin-2 n=1 Tax=Heptranchias perlo TaxID=212740 RepID=UPI00355A6A4A
MDAICDLSKGPWKLLKICEITIALKGIGKSGRLQASPSHLLAPMLLRQSTKAAASAHRHRWDPVTGTTNNQQKFLGRVTTETQKGISSKLRARNSLAVRCVGTVCGLQDETVNQSCLCAFSHKLANRLISSRDSTINMTFNCHDIFGAQLNRFPMNISLWKLLISPLVLLPITSTVTDWAAAQSTKRNFGPVFEEQPRNTLYPEGSAEGRVTLSCHVRASPPSTYRWKVNGTEVNIEGDSRYSLVGGNLVISNPTRSKDPGSYQCLATNTFGTVISKETFLRFGYLSQFSTEERDPVKVPEGVGVMLPCNAPPHYPGPSYRWFIDEIPNFITPDNRHFISQVTGNLYIANTKASDAGAHSCYLTSHIDYATTSVFSKPIPLAVQSVGEARPHSPHIRVKFPSETYTLAGQSLNLECFAFGNPVPAIKWRKLDGLLPPKILRSINEPILHVPDVQFEDEGVYECEAENAKGKDSTQGRIIVHAQPEWLQIISDTEADIGSNLWWKCAAAGKPRPICRWLRNGLSLTSKSRLDVNNCALKVSRLALEDSGMYQCVAENKHGTIYANAELKVQAFRPDFQSNSVKRLIPAARGGEVLIECRPRSAPKPSIFWSKGTEILSNNTRMTITPDGTLRIWNISRADEGKYTCFAENFLGKANSTGIVSVRDATKITLAPSNADINLGEDVILQCHASHDPTMDLTFTWSVNESPIDFDIMAEHFQRVSTRETIGDLKITNVQLKHSGRYTCTAQTVVDSAHASGTLVVRGPPGPPGGVVGKEINDSSVLLSWSRGYDNHSPIGRYIIQARTSLSDEWKSVRTAPQQIEGNAESAWVTNLIPWMDYEFRVTAKNILGTGDPSLPSQTIRTKEAAPTVAPSSISGGGGDRHEVTMLWAPVPREYHNGEGFGYIVTFRKEGTKEWKNAKVLGSESSRYVYQNETIAPYSRFEVRVMAFNSKGQGPYSQTAIIYSAEEEPSVAPSGVTASSLSSSEIEVSWKPVGPVTMNGILLGYEIRYWRENDKEASADRVRTPGLETSARVPGLKPSTLYHVEVRAYNSAGSGPSTRSTTVVTKKAPPNRPPSKISWKSFGSWVRIKWDHVKAFENESTVDGYKVLYKNEDQSAIKIIETNKNSVQLPLPDDMSYLVVIRASGEGGDGAAAKIRISKSSGTSMMVDNSGIQVLHNVLFTAIVTLTAIGCLEL